MKPQQILNKLAKYNEVQKVELSAEPMKVEFADMDVIINDIKNFNLDSSLNIASQAQKLLEKASNNAYTAARAAEIRLQSLEKLIAKGKEFGFDVRQLESFKSMAERHVQQANELGKSLNDAQGKALVAIR